MTRKKKTKKMCGFFSKKIIRKKTRKEKNEKD